jgi:hypothetical protein
LARKKDRAKAPRPKARPRIARAHYTFAELYPNLTERQRAISSGKTEWRMPSGEPYPKISAADRKLLYQALAAEMHVAPQSARQRLIDRVAELRAQGEKKVVESAAAELGIPLRTAYDWVKRARV